MSNQVLLIIGATLPMIWGIAHLFPIKGVIKEFGNISDDNRKILTMEWINEAITLIFAGIIILVVTLFGDSNSITAKIVYGIVSGMLLCMTILSLFTGARINFLPYRLCPVFFLSGMICILLGGIFL